MPILKYAPAPPRIVERSQNYHMERLDASQGPSEPRIIESANLIFVRIDSFNPPGDFTARGSAPISHSTRSPESGLVSWKVDEKTGAENLMSELLYHESISSLNCSSITWSLDSRTWYRTHWKYYRIRNYWESLTAEYQMSCVLQMLTITYISSCESWPKSNWKKFTNVVRFYGLVLKNIPSV